METWHTALRITSVQIKHSDNTDLLQLSLFALNIVIQSWGAGYTNQCKAHLSILISLTGWVQVATVIYCVVHVYYCQSGFLVIPSPWESSKTTKTNASVFTKAELVWVCSVSKLTSYFQETSNTLITKILFSVFILPPPPTPYCTSGFCYKSEIVCSRDCTVNQGLKWYVNKVVLLSPRDDTRVFLLVSSPKMSCFK